MKNNQDKKKSEKIVCEKCNSSFGYIRLTSDEFQCRSCGHITKLNKKKREEN